MRIDTWLKKTTQSFVQAGIASAHLDATLLLEDALKADRTHLFAHPELTLDTQQLNQLDRRVRRRMNREPLAYIRGHCEFYGRTFTVSKHVLIPRPESESFISLLLKKHTNENSLLDVGTGSGVLGITAKLEIPQLTVTLSDLSTHALSTAKQNADYHSVVVDLKHGNLLEVFNKNNIVFANLPYVPETSEFGDQKTELSHEPHEALYSGNDGMNHYRKFWKQLAELHFRPQLVFVESLAFQHEHMIDLAEKAEYKISDAEGLVQVFTDQPASV